MNLWRKRIRGKHNKSGEQGQSLLETAIGIPLMLALAFNAINIGYFWFVMLSVASAPRQGAEYATQGGTGSASQAPGTDNVSNLVYDNLTNAIKGATTSNAGVQVCTNAKGVTGTGSSQVSLCQQYNYSLTTSPAPDPEAPTFVLDRVDVVYTVAPIIPGSAFAVVLPSNLQFHRAVSMRSLY